MIYSGKEMPQRPVRCVSYSDHGRLHSKAGVYVGSRNTTAGAIRGPQHGVSQSPGCFRLAWGEGNRPLQLPPQCSTHPLRGPHPGKMRQCPSYVCFIRRMLGCALRIGRPNRRRGEEEKRVCVKGRQMFEGCFRRRFKAGG